MRAGDVAGNGEAQARAAALQIAALVEAMEGPEGFIPAVFGNARAVIFHGDLDQPVILAQGDGHMRAMLEGIVDQVGQHAVALTVFPSITNST